MTHSALTIGEGGAEAFTAEQEETFCQASENLVRQLHLKGLRSRKKPSPE